MVSGSPANSGLVGVVLNDCPLTSGLKTMTTNAAMTVEKWFMATLEECAKARQYRSVTGCASQNRRIARCWREWRFYGGNQLLHACAFTSIMAHAPHNPADHTVIIIDPAAVVRFEKLAAANPGRYRRRVIATAIAGDLALTFLQLLPPALILGVPLIFYRQPLFYWAASIAFVLFAWFLRPTFRETGCELTQVEAPTLFAELSRLRTGAI